MKTCSADLPLHGGHVPAWLASRMARLGRVVVEALVLEYGRDEVLRRLAGPFWFQSNGRTCFDDVARSLRQLRLPF